MIHEYAVYAAGVLSEIIVVSSAKTRFEYFDLN